MRRKDNVKMQRRHYEFIAATVAMLDGDCRRNAAGLFAEMLKLTNPQFQAAKFLEACNVSAACELDQLAKQLVEDYARSQA